MDGEQLTFERTGAVGPTVTDVVFVTPFQAAEIVTGVETVTAAAVAVKLADVAPAGIAIEAGTGKTAELDVRATVVVVCDAELMVAVQVVLPAEAIEDGEQLTLERVGVAVDPTVTDVVFVTPFQVAEMVTGVAAVTAVAVAGKLADVAPAGIVIEAGTGRTAELDERETVVTLCAAALSVAVQVVFPAEAIVDGLHEIPDSVGVPPRMVTVPPVPDIGTGSPRLDEPTGFATEMFALVDRLGAMPSVTVAMTPDGMLAVFIPVATHV